jgi:hypothetical protein
MASYTTGFKMEKFRGRLPQEPLKNTGRQQGRSDDLCGFEESANNTGKPC